MLLALGTLLFQIDAASIFPAGVHEPGQGVTPPTIRKKVPADFPEKARAIGVNGVVFLDLVIDEGGFPTNLSVFSSSGFGFDEEALRAVSEWRFNPGELNGTPVKVEVTVQVNFEAQGGSDAFEGREDTGSMSIY